MAKEIAPKIKLQKPKRSLKPSTRAAAIPNTIMAPIKGITPKLRTLVKVLNDWGKMLQSPLKSPIIAPPSKAPRGFTSIPRGGIQERTSRVRAFTTNVISRVVTESTSGDDKK
jgi:hypothetical protein